MAADIHIAGYTLTADQWASMEPRLRSQLIQQSMPRAQAWIAHASSTPMAPVPPPRVEPGPDPATVIIHAAAPERAPTGPVYRRASRTSDCD